MRKKRHNAKGKKKEKQLGSDKPSGNDDNLILEKYSGKSPHSGKAIVLFFSSAVVVLAIVLWQYFNKGSVEKHSISSSSSTTSLSELFRIACKKTKLAHCEKGVFEIIDETRSIRTRESENRKPLITRGQLLIEIPRTMQITTIDALRDPVVRNILRQNPRHPKSGKPLDPKAFLALHMSFQLHQIRTTEIGINERVEYFSPHEHVRRAYLEYLPTHRDFMKFHPVSRQSIGYFESGHTIESIGSLSPSVALTDHLVDQYFRSFLSEYEALRGVSIEFKRGITLEDWITSRLIVNTRSFNSDPLTETDMSNEELDSYRPFLDENYTNQDSSALLYYDKCRKKSMRSCMVPLLDAFDHDPKENIGWEFRGERSPVTAEKSFITYATKDVNPDSNLFDSYFRSRPDPFVFAQYGFVTSDGLGERAALLTPYHRLLADDFENEKSFMSSHTIDRDDELRKYTAFKDGYENCDITNGEDFEPNERKEFEVAKFRALKAISNIVNSWVASLPSREDESGGDLGNILSTCRLLALTHRDYGGRATEMLQTMANADYPEGYQFQISSDETTSNGLEYRAVHVLERLASEMRSRVAGSLASMTSFDFGEIGVEMFRQKLELQEIEISKFERSSILVRLGELETLTKLCKDAQEYKQILISNRFSRSANSDSVDTEDYIVRVSPCQQ